MKHFLLPVALLTGLPISAQTLNVEAGISISKLQDSFTREFYSQHITTPTFGLGLQYYERKYFDLSTNVGYLRKGGHEPYAYNDASGQPRGADFTLDYVSVNTLAEPKIPLDKHLGLFISVGPRLDFLAGHQDSNVVFHAQPLQKTAFGLTLGGGFHYTISRLRFTGQADYLSNSTHIYTNGTTTIYDRTITITFSAGYRL